MPHAALTPPASGPDAQMPATGRGGRIEARAPVVGLRTTDPRSAIGPADAGGRTVRPTHCTYTCTCTVRTGS
ncbi:hypothetical protein GCM10025792_13000 [Pseudonocardia tropica]